MSENSREKILATARNIAQAHGYGGLNYRDLAEAVGIKPASIYHHFPSKADLAAAVARRYWEDMAAGLEALSTEAGDPLTSLRRYPGTFRKALANGNRLCLCSFMAAEYDNLPEIVQAEVISFTDVNIAWLGRMLTAAAIVGPEASEARARAILAAVAGAQLFARGRADVAIYDALIESYRTAGLLP